MTLEKALEASTERAKIMIGENRFRPAAYIKQDCKLPIYAFSKDELRYTLASAVGDVGYDCHFLLAKYMLRRRTDWEPRLQVNF